MPAIFCHNCQRQFSVAANAGECPACHGGFVEEVQAQPQQPPLFGGMPGAAPARTPAGNGNSYTRTFTLPGGGRGTVVVSTGGGMPAGFDMPGMGALPGMVGMPGMGEDAYIRGVLEALTGAGFTLPGAAGAGGIPFPPGAGGQRTEQEWLDQVMSQIMAEYQPASQATSQRAVRSLPSLSVRPKDAQGDPGEGQAVARAGEPCSVCHDEFKEGEAVLELPCNHGYHKDCVLPWLETHNTCPVCRHELPAEDPSVEARRQQRTDAATAAASARGASNAARQQQQQRAGAQAAAGGGGGNRLADLLTSISASWDSLRGDHSVEVPAQRQQQQEQQQSAAAAAAAGAAPTAGSSRAAAGAGQGSSGRPQASSSAHADEPAAGWASTSANPSSSGSLRQRRDAAAAAAERRLHGDTAAAAPATTGGVGGMAPSPFSDPSSAAAQPTGSAQAPPGPPRREHPPQEEEEQGGVEGMAVAGAVAGGLLGALLGGALMLFGGRRRDRD